MARAKQPKHRNTNASPKKSQRIVRTYTRADLRVVHQLALEALDTLEAFYPRKPAERPKEYFDRVGWYPAASVQAAGARQFIQGLVAGIDYNVNRLFRTPAQTKHRAGRVRRTGS